MGSKPSAIDIVGELATVIERISGRQRKRHSAFLIQDDDGRPLTMLALRGCLPRRARLLGRPFSSETSGRKTACDTGDLEHSQKLLGRKNRDRTKHYARERVGQRVKPLP